MIFVDLGQEIQANKMTIYGTPDRNRWQYQPTYFKLYGIVDKDDLKLIYEVEDATVTIMLKQDSNQQNSVITNQMQQMEK